MPINKKILSIPFCQLTASEVLAKIDHTIKQNKQLLLTVLDVAMVVNVKSNPQSFTAICASDLIVADGYYVALALRFLGHGSIEQITGFDTMLNVMRLAKERRYKVFFFGAEESIVRNV
ncbi:MAG: WecB/TagA/CpsF family glycosyltransferase, partial [Methylococcaceae bacterium]